MLASPFAGRSAVLQVTKAENLFASRDIVSRILTGRILAVCKCEAQIRRPRRAGMTRATGGQRGTASAAPAAAVAAVDALLARFSERPKCIVFDLVSYGHAVAVLGSTWRAF